jgi:ribosomal protein S27E
LEPIGIGTPFSEGLTSYLSRLADEHCVSVNTIISREIAPLLTNKYLGETGKRGTNRFYEYAGKLNGVSQGIFEFTEIIGKITLRKDLRYLTMTTWKNGLSPRGLIRSIKAWCPLCYEEWKSKGMHIYDPLLWAIKAVNICPVHQERLVTRCTICNREILIFSRFSRLGHCDHCGNWLGSTIGELSEELYTKEELRWDLWVSQNIGQIIELSPKTTETLERETIIKSIISFSIPPITGFTGPYI